MNETTFLIEPNTQSIITERTFNASLEAVFQAFTDPIKVAKWWGGKLYQTKMDVFEPKAGGSWRMVQTDGSNEYAFHGVFHEVASNERIIWTFEFEGMPEAGHVLMETIYFTESKGKTLVKSVSVFQSVEDRDGMIASGMEEGSRSAYDTLAELVEA